MLLVMEAGVDEGGATAAPVMTQYRALIRAQPEECTACFEPFGLSRVLNAASVNLRCSY